MAEKQKKIIKNGYQPKKKPVKPNVKPAKPASGSGEKK